MKPLSSLGIGLSLVFGCLFLALVAEVYYLLWWKKRITNREIEEDYNSSTRELFYLLCWKKPKSSSLSSAGLNPHTSVTMTESNGNLSDHAHHHQPLSDNGTYGMDFLLKPCAEEEMDAELMRVHNLNGPPRFLFTIVEETKEDLDSEDGKSRGGDRSRKGSRGKSLSDLLLATESPFLTPLSSPPFVTPPLTPLDRYNQHGFNPLFEAFTDAEVSRMRTSPPPKFKFLRDAEDKLYRKTLRERALRVQRNGGAREDDGVKGSPASSNEEEGSFITILVGKSKEKEQHSSSQVLPLTLSPLSTKIITNKSILH